jgi:hypothetical protein
MANHNFEFAQFSNFAAPTNFDELMRQFQTAQAHHEEAVKARDQARREHQQWQEYLDLCTDYRDLFSSMMKKLLDAKTGTDIEKIRSIFGNKLVPLLQKLNVIQKMIQGQPTPAQLESRNEVANKFERVRELLAEATKLKQEIVVPEPTPAG